ncbi:hypothetical protein PILCRDRAFT_819161 [Piloderma croceum F 1598]|uniref:Uncharacterized protein n=1 Tax=Piloderma croceum (strain F 1598) TaxID=765440 RepID=A0A0C3BB60_PILCF|nr:hypothetical protein PILCRDRAFT_819161 [Piloderma croceum F 1598]
MRQYSFESSQALSYVAPYSNLLQIAHRLARRLHPLRVLIVARNLEIRQRVICSFWWLLQNFSSHHRDTEISIRNLRVLLATEFPEKLVSTYCRFAVVV